MRVQERWLRKGAIIEEEREAIFSETVKDSFVALISIFAGADGLAFSCNGLSRKRFL